MSSILKALRKLEEEKRGGQLAAPDLRVDQGQSVGKRGLLLPMVTGSLIGAVAMGMFLIWAIVQKDPVPTGHAAATKKNNPPAPLQAVTATALTSPSKEPTWAAGAAVPESAGDVVTTTVTRPAPAPRLKAAPDPAVISPPAGKDPQPSQSAVTTREHRVASTAAVLSEPSQTLPAGVVLAVTEVFCQENAANSMAVVNDLPVMVGTYVDTAVVTDIRPDQVLFAIEGETFAVPLAGPN